MSAVEFALVAPVFALILAAGTDLGLVLFARFEINAAVSSGAAYVLAHTDMVNSESGKDLAEDTARLIAHTGTLGMSDASVVVNNGPTAELSGSTIALGGSALKADACYCPNSTADGFEWGAMSSCGNDCPDGGQAGKFVSVSVSRAHQPLFSGYGIVAEDGTISASALVEVQ
ncbi:TadE/TadG family type IV pilus assembly protein [Pelagibacterium halotolerans]|uniref:TadE/TadG family type IV pilus assembly protein n=1 Tax=Pelagibacterium halotolerans TaxID=531813 RepID=UPI00384D90E1